MAIKGPKGAEPSPRGWVHPKTGELLKAQKIAPHQISEWWGHQAPAAAVTPAPVLQTLHEAPVVEHHVSEEEYNFHHVDLSEGGQEESPADDDSFSW